LLAKTRSEREDVHVKKLRDTTKLSQKQDQTSKRLTYQPFLFGFSFLGLIGELLYTLSAQKEIWNPLLWVALAIFGLATTVYLTELRTRYRAGRVAVESTVTTGTLADAEVHGARVKGPTDAKVQIKTGNVRKGKIYGYEES
jgi:hypothetical protein